MIPSTINMLLLVVCYTHIGKCFLFTKHLELKIPSQSTACLCRDQTSASLSLWVSLRLTNWLSIQKYIYGCTFDSINRDWSTATLRLITIGNVISLTATPNLTTYSLRMMGILPTFGNTLWCRSISVWVLLIFTSYKI